MKITALIGSTLLALTAVACASPAAEGTTDESNLSVPLTSEWLVTSPTQCGSNPWEQFETDGDESAHVLGFFRSQGVEIEQIGFVNPAEPMLVCMACQCPRGDRLVVKAKDMNAARALVSQFDFSPLSGALAYSPVSCGMNPWAGDDSANGSAAEAHAIVQWASSIGAPVSAAGFVNSSEPAITCMACGCPRGDLAIVFASGEAAAKLEAQGFSPLAN